MAAQHPFDFLESNVMKVTTGIFGYEASWTPSTGGAPVTGKVLLRLPTKKDTLQGAEFMVVCGYIEYERGVLPGLEEAVKNTGNEERITVNGKLYFVRQPSAKYDGDTIVLDVDPIST